jgi:hypothetical protein
MQFPQDNVKLLRSPHSGAVNIDLKRDTAQSTEFVHRSLEAVTGSDYTIKIDMKEMG